jgi:hypothetical protein
MREAKAQEMSAIFKSFATPERRAFLERAKDAPAL